jgi:autotransporter-associated beta strand protein
MADGTSLRYEDLPANSDTINNPIRIADGATAEIFTYGQNNVITYWNGAISGGTAASPVTVVFSGAAPSYHAIAQPSAGNTFVGQVEVRGNLYLIGTGPNSFGDAANTVAVYGTTWGDWKGLRTVGSNVLIPQDIVLHGTCVLESYATQTTYSGDITDGGANDSVAYLASYGEVVLLGNNSPGQWLLYNSGPTLTVGTQANLGAAPVQSAYTSADARVRFTGAGTETFTNEFSGTAGNNTNKTLTLEVQQAPGTVLLTGGVWGAANNKNLAKAGPGRLDINGSLNNTGTTSVSAGTLNVNVATAANQGSYMVASGATLGGTGTINLAAGSSVTVNGGGVLSPGASPGTLTVTGGNVIMGAGSTVWMEVAGTGAGEFDAVTVTGGLVDLSAGGVILDVTILSPYYSQPGDTFRIVNATSVSGTFGELRWNGWTTGSVYTVAYDAAGALLTFSIAIPEPGALALLALAGTILLPRRRFG